ncbi:hypothetical protein [Sedimentibacter sp. B4]|uniref:hypothetical protein n=1 Tax=Sedimentibacter sp. B4 TaxID=304766 RepID=UPI0002F67B77|nr:hypothetical protein [Sedimentibacter sp. B4]
MSYLYTAFDIAMLIIHENLKIKEEECILTMIWEMRYALLEPQLRTDKKNFFKKIRNVIYQIENLYDCNSYVKENKINTFESFFRVVKLKLYYTHNTDYFNIKYKILLQKLGYKEKTQELIKNINGFVEYIGLKMNTRGSKKCNLNTLNLDKTIVFKLNDVFDY